ncbi:MAG: hypothetical protein AAF721_16465 [Myxococcota bacterium]
MYYAAIALTIVANVGYHLFQKSIRADVSPAASLVVTYAVALACSVVMLAVSAKARPMTAALSQTGWASYALGVSIVALEIGFLLAYRAGWDLGLAAPYANVAVALVLLPIGVLAFDDGLTPRKLGGVGLAIAAIVLLSGRPEAAPGATAEPAAPAD